MSGGVPLPVSQCETQKVNFVQFEIFKAKQIKANAVCQITEAKSFVNGRPADGGISDLRMGSTTRAFNCATCNMPNPECPGHFGYIELAEPLFNIGVFDIVLQVMRCVCKKCGALLASDDEITEDAKLRTGLNRLREMVRCCGGKRKCRERVDAFGVPKGCGQDQPKVGRPQGIYPGLMIEVVENEQRKLWYGEETRAVLDRITDEDAVKLGFKPERCHPRDLLLTVLPVPPPAVRPTVSFGSAQSDNELSHILIAILKENERLSRGKESTAGREAIYDTRANLQEKVACYFHNGSTMYKPMRASNSSKVPFKSLAERLKGKYGRLRGNLMGKRVDFSARTVITGDPNIDVDEVGVPRSVAMTLSFPERVNALNMKRLTETVRRTDYPTATTIFHPNGKSRMLTALKPSARKNLTLSIGDVVERNIMDGDCVLFNRQPTLHRMSMMGHRARVLPFNTFRLNLSCTTPYNADFDGDEMNLHVPQSLLTKAELMEMMMVPKNFVSPNKSMPCMGIVQDSLLGSFKITNKEVFLDKYFVQNLCMWVGPEREVPIPAILKPEPLWTGKQIFSLILPEITYVRWDGKDDKRFSDEDKSLVIRRGKLLTGWIGKSHVGVASGSMIHIIFNEKGSDAVSQFINGVQRITANYLYNASFSVGVQDCVMEASILNEIAGIVKNTTHTVRQIHAAANEGRLQKKPGMNLLQSFENEVNACLNDCRENSGKLALANVKRTNAFRFMIDCGSKGSHLNICQIAVMVGQQNVGGQRIPFHFRRRTLPHFSLDDYGEMSRGMVSRGFLEGLYPEEFFFHTMGGREGLIDTAVKTADTGYLQRKLIKALEDVTAAYDGTVRNANREVVQFMYGEDGLDGQRIEAGQSCDIVGKKNSDFVRDYKFEYNDDGTLAPNFGGDYLDIEMKKKLRQSPQSYIEFESEYRQLVQDRENARKWFDRTEEHFKIALPVNLERLIENVQAVHGVGRKHQVSNLSPIDIIHSVRQLFEELQQFFPSYNRVPGQPHLYTSHHNKNRIDQALQLFGIQLRSFLSAKRVLRDYRLNDKAFGFLLGEIRQKYLQAVVKPGEMLGAIAAQSCGEPATQMTLNTFHNAGISSKNVTLGVPRLQEILNVSRSQKNSSVTIGLVPSWATRDQSRLASNLTAYANLETIAIGFQIVFDPAVTDSIVASDHAFVQDDWDPMFWPEAMVETRQQLLEKLRASPWVARLLLDSDMMADKKLEMAEVKEHIEKAAPGVYHMEMQQVLGERRVVRLRRINPVVGDQVAALKNDIPQLLQKVELRGIKGLTKVLCQKIDRFPVDPETGGVKRSEEWALDTEGTNLKAIFADCNDLEGNYICEPTTTSSNNVPEIYRILGVEAARRKMYLEMRSVYSNYGVVINYRHYSVLLDAMCHRGYLMAVSRVGINRSGAGPLMCTSFEETVKVLMQAAAFGDSDPVDGVSANIILGNQAKIGTGAFELVLNEAQLKDAVPQEEAIRTGAHANVYHSMSSVVRHQPSTAPDPAQPRTPAIGDFTPKHSVAPSSIISQYGGMSASIQYSSTSAGSGLGLQSREVPSSAPYSASAASNIYAPVPSSQYPTYGAESPVHSLQLISTQYHGYSLMDSSVSTSRPGDSLHHTTQRSPQHFEQSAPRSAANRFDPNKGSQSHIDSAPSGSDVTPYQPRGLGEFYTLDSQNYSSASHLGGGGGSIHSRGGGFDPVSAPSLFGSTPYVPHSFAGGSDVASLPGSLPGGLRQSPDHPVYTPSVPHSEAQPPSPAHPPAPAPGKKGPKKR